MESVIADSRCRTRARSICCASLTLCHARLCYRLDVSAVYCIIVADATAYVSASKHSGPDCSFRLLRAITAAAVRGLGLMAATLSCRRRLSCPFYRDYAPLLQMLPSRFDGNSQPCDAVSGRSTIPATRNEHIVTDTDHSVALVRRERSALALDTVSQALISLVSDLRLHAESSRAHPAARAAKREKTNTVLSVPSPTSRAVIGQKTPVFRPKHLR